ncbi:MAG: hypothetical protein ACE5H1_09540 [Thermodesulfobacteriota bacterium]
MNRFFLIISIVFISGCVTSEGLHKAAEDSKALFNITSTGISEFDGSKHIRITNIRCNDIAFRLYQDTAKAKRAVVLLEAGVQYIENIANGESLQIKLDSTTISLKTNDVTTNYTSEWYGSGAYATEKNISLKTYIVPESTIEAIAKSNLFIARVHLLDNTYVEDKCSFLTLEEMRDRGGKYVDRKIIDQKYVDITNQSTALVGLRKFVKLMNETKL